MHGVARRLIAPYLYVNDLRIFGNFLDSGLFQSFPNTNNSRLWRNTVPRKRSAPFAPRPSSHCLYRDGSTNVSRNRYLQKFLTNLTITMYCIIAYNCSVLLYQVFNPNLIGYSTGTGEFISTKAKLNIAFPVAATEDALQQARILVQRIKRDRRINIKKQWKVCEIL